MIKREKHLEHCAGLFAANVRIGSSVAAFLFLPEPHIKNKQPVYQSISGTRLQAL